MSNPKKTIGRNTAGKQSKPKKEETKILAQHMERLFVDLTAPEYDDRAQQLAQVEYDLQAHYSHEEATKKVLKATETRLKERRAGLSAAVKSRKELRDVLVHGIADYKAGKYREVRTDTGEVINERPLSLSERQDSLPLKQVGAATLPPTAEERKKKEQDALESQADDLLKNAGFGEDGSDAGGEEAPF